VPLSAYVATKGGVLGFTRSLARELRPARHPRQAHLPDRSMIGNKQLHGPAARARARAAQRTGETQHAPPWSRRMALSGTGAV